ACRSNRDRGRRAVRRVERRQSLPRVRGEDRKRIVVDEARAARQCEPDHVSGQEREAVCGGGRHGHARGVRAALTRDAIKAIDPTSAVTSVRKRRAIEIVTPAMAGRPNTLKIRAYDPSATPIWPGTKNEPALK